jgi:hypothetical protein
MSLQPEPQPYQANQSHAKITQCTQLVASSNHATSVKRADGDPPPRDH